MKHYELNCIVSPKTSEEEIKNLSEKINNFIQEEDGKLKEIIKPFKKGLGFLATLNFSLEPGKLGNLEKKLKTEDKILRYLILAKRVKEKMPGKRISSEIKTSSPIFEKKAKSKKVELKDIDKKIEEILNAD